MTFRMLFLFGNKGKISYEYLRVVCRIRGKFSYENLKVVRMCL